MYTTAFRAYVMLGRCYQYGRGVGNDYKSWKKAVSLYKAAAGNCSAQAECDLGFCLVNG
jgi:TPR repeat protein